MPAPPPGGWRGGGYGGANGGWSGGDAGGPATGASNGRWGGRIGGYWYGGAQAPGGWQAYRPLTRGRTLPRYWLAPGFYVGDYSIYGLTTPPPGYYWSRYYDDAVLIDRNGRVYDSVGGLDWDGYGDDSAYGGGYAEGAGQDGYPGYGASYGRPGGYPAPLPPVAYRSSTYTTTSGNGGYVAGGYYFPPTTTVVVTVPSPVVTTTTTTEFITETAYVARRKTYRAPVKRKWRPAVRRCTCTCACR
ncbi:RcnB family protein [uncultured Sphingomonas sp.]|uniref:RcnB family protein n=1 Tax=uncultured Sphingomonas sp. TaxID=158754 RepID=UPI0035CA795B